MNQKFAARMAWKNNCCVYTHKVTCQPCAGDSECLCKKGGILHVYAARHYIVNVMRNSLYDGIQRSNASRTAGEGKKGHPSTGRNLLRDSRELENGR